MTPAGKSSTRWRDRRSGQTVELTFHWGIVGGRVECVRLELAPKDPDQQVITTSLVRPIPIKALIDRERRKRLADIESMAKAPGAVGSRALAQLPAYRAAADDRGGGRRSYPPQHWADVAAVYADAPDRPTQAVARAWTVSPTTAAKWVARARQQGLLPPTTRGRSTGSVRKRRSTR